jgi:hypothetical protein
MRCSKSARSAVYESAASARARHGRRLFWVREPYMGVDSAAPTDVPANTSALSSRGMGSRLYVGLSLPDLKPWKHLCRRKQHFTAQFDASTLAKKQSRASLEIVGATGRRLALQGPHGQCRRHRKRRRMKERRYLTQIPARRTSSS